MEMNMECDFCMQKAEIGEGFYDGTGYAIDALTSAFSASTFMACWLLTGVSWKVNSVFWCQGTNTGLIILLQPIFNFIRCLYRSCKTNDL